jgi:monofunctional biosynthetic peptidoglycan transglycosylase
MIMTSLQAISLSLAMHSADAAFELMPLYDFSREQDAAAWRPVHDSVMGGISRGRAVPVEDAVRFEGTLSLENNGGFASFRIAQRLPDLSEYDGIRLRVRGDGQIYRLSLRPDPEWDRISWKVPFTTQEGEWTVVHLAFEDLVPTWRGRLVASESRFDPAHIHQLGIMIADKQAGPYQLDIASIEGWKAPQVEREGTLSAARARTMDLARSLDAGAGLTTVLEKLTDQERLFILSAPYDGDTRLSVQVGRLLGSVEALADRDLRIVNLMGTRGGRLAGRTLSSGMVRALRERWDLADSEWSLTLVGKDGEVKRRWDDLVEAQEVFDIIDAMPMRRHEMADRSQ